MCAVGQIRVLGTGHDCLGVEHVIFIEPPRVVSDLLQGMSRHRRLVTKETLSLARSDVYVWYLRAQLDEDVVGLVPSQAHRDVLRQGSVYERAMDRMVAQAREYSELTSHPTKIKLAEDTTVSEVITVLSKDLEVLSKKREEFHELSDARLEELFIRYRSSEKEAWRKALADFVERALRIFRKDPTELAVALLPGPEALEIPVYCERGISPSRICAFEAHPDVVVREHCAKQVQRFGARFFSSRIEEIFPIIQRDIPIDIISLDTNGYMTPELFEMVVSWRMPQQGMLQKNALCGREQGEAAELLEAAGNDRRELDRILLRLAGTQLHQTLQIHDMPALIVAARHIEAVCRCVAEVLNSKTVHSLDDLTSLLMSYACGAHVRVREEHQFDYQTAGCSPFLSTFALLERLTLEPDRELAARALGEQLRSLGLQCGSKVEALSVKVTKRARVFRVEVSSGEVQAALLIPEAVIRTTPYSRNEGEEEIVN